MLIVKIIALIVAFIVTMFPIAAAAPVPSACVVEVFEPQALTRELLAALPSTGIAAVNLNRDAPAGDSTRSLLLRDGKIVGELYSSVDARAGKSEMTVLSSTGDVLMHFQESRNPCIASKTGALCSHIEGFTEMEAPLDHTPAFGVYISPDDKKVTYFQYDTQLSNADYGRAMLKEMDSLTSTLDATDVFREPVNATAAEKLYWALASNADVAPYVDRLKITTKRDHLEIQGVVPSTLVYDQVMETLLAGSLWKAVPDLTIDTTSAIVDNRPTLSDCRGTNTKQSNDLALSH